MNATAIIKEFKSLRADSQVSEGLAIIQQGLRRGAFELDSLDQVGRLLLRYAESFPKKPKPISVLILGQCTTSWILPALTAIAWGRGAAVSMREGGYDNIIQDLSALSVPPDVIVLLPWHQRVMARDSRTSQQKIDDEIVFLTQAWGMVRRTGSRLVHVGYDLEQPGAAGYHLSGRSDGDVSVLRTLNQQVRSSLPEGSYFVDLEQISGYAGRQNFYDPRGYFWTKQPFSRLGVARLSEHLWAGIRAVTTGPKKVLVLDLDNTLWGGVVGELGALGVELGDNAEGEAFRAFQQEAKDLSTCGVVLAVCSKNNPADAREVFEKNESMILKLADIACFEASWDPKPLALQRIAKTLRLGLDSFVFFDDNPAEREHVLQALPEVEVIDVPIDAAGFVRALSAGLWFESSGVTEADRTRADQYRDETMRREAQESAGSVELYLESLQMLADVRPLDESDMERAVQLLGKTNQFNLTTRRHSAEIVRQMVGILRSVHLTVRLSDRFGDAGLVSLILAVPSEEASMLRIDTWLMSCRVIARTVEDFLINQLAAAAVNLSYQRLCGEFCPTAKNHLVADLYERMGFTLHEELADGAKTYELDLTKFVPRPTCIHLKD